jgi:non-structural maintenance of chromosomes element 1
MDHDVVPPDYNDGNRAFLQALMARGTLTYREAKPILAAIMTAAQGEAVAADAVTEHDFDAYLEAARGAVSHFDYEIRNTMHQVRKERVHALVNTTSDPLTQLATLHSADEIAFVKRLLDAMFETYNSRRMEIMCVDSIQANKCRHAPRVAADPDESVTAAADGESQATQAATQAKGLKSSEVEAVLRALVDEGWLEKMGRDGFYGLTPRALLELRGWLVASYNDGGGAAGEREWQRIKFCEACREIVTVGQRCADPDCPVRLHDICDDAFWRTRRERKCPLCTADWTGRHFVGPRAVTETDAYKRRKGGCGRARGSLVDEVLQNENGVDGEEDGEEGEEESAGDE